MDDGPPVQDDGSGRQPIGEPYFSIVTITKDDPAGIRRTVGSVESQDFSRYQHVVVNGGSQPDVARWLEEWRDADPGRHLLIDNAPPGIYPAMNAGIDGTTAPLVVVVNGGDELRPGALTAVAEHHRLHRWRWAYGGVEGKDPDGNRLGDHTFHPFSQLVFRSGIDFIPHTAAYVTRQLYREVGLYREDLGTAADQEFFLRASLVARPDLIPGLLATFEVGGTSSHEGVLRRELVWHRLRLASNTAFGGSSAADLVVTASLVARQSSLPPFEGRDEQGRYIGPRCTMTSEFRPTSSSTIGHGRHRWCPCSHPGPRGPVKHGAPHERRNTRRQPAELPSIAVTRSTVRRSGSVGTVEGEMAMEVLPAARDSRVYIAGHRGLAGSAIWRALDDAGIHDLVGARSADVDLRDRAAAFDYVMSVRPDIIVLAAARVGGIVANNTYPADFLSENLRIQVNVMDAALAAGVERLLFLGSSCIYPKFAEQLIRESSLLTGALEPTNDAYAIAKIAGIMHVQAVRRQHGLGWISAMPTNLYGPGDNFDPQNSHVLPGLIRRFHEAVEDGRDSVTLWGTGTPRREFLHADDLGRAVVRLLDVYDEAEHINVGVGVDLTIRELAEIIAEVVGFTGEIVQDTSRPDGTPRKLLDVARIRALGWEPSVPLREGIESTFRWFVDRRAEARLHG